MPARLRGRGKRIVAHIDANAPCEVILAAFNREDGQLAYGWPPLFVQVPALHEVVVPSAPITWSWEKNVGAPEIDVLVMWPHSKRSTELGTLINAMQNSKSEALEKLQTNKLRQLIGQAKIEQAGKLNSVKLEPIVSGVFRVMPFFDWRESARAVNFAENKPGILTFRSAFAK